MDTGNTSSLNVILYSIYDFVEGLDAVSFCKGLNRMWKRMNLAPRPQLFLLEMMFFSSRMLVIHVWYTVNLSNVVIHEVLYIYCSCTLSWGHKWCLLFLYSSFATSLI